MDLRDYIRNVPDFPKPGILFRDITPLLKNPGAFRQAIEMLVAELRPRQVELVAAAEARGFLFAAPIALALEAGLIPIRKSGKLPCQTLSHTYQLEYGTDTLEMHADAIQPGQRVVVVDDVLATGGTVEACCRLVEKAGGIVVGCAFLIELRPLGGRERIARYHPVCLISYD
ncbi:MAG: adenine phosphoribosyltransferase [Thermoguttaceae bacterium]|nr:adenine phosphoribosyltransferase [Thermoguttaceae bacterium]